MKKFLSILLSVLTVISLLSVGLVSASAADSISYSFTKAQRGFAEGTVTLTAEDGTYYLYWADNEKALEGMDTLGALDVSSGKGTLTMPLKTAIPAGAEKLIAIKSSSKPASLADCTVSLASAVYSIPASKQISSEALYSFGAISDPQLANDSYDSEHYPYDEIHLAAAFETLAKRGVDFTVSSGDTVNDQNGKQTYQTEYKRYQQILADSSYAMPIYEANGNHDVGVVWNGSSKTDFSSFIKATGLDSKAETIKAGKGYFEVTEPKTGDHFIFMALEGAFYTDENTQFSTEQLDWLEGLLQKYSSDGKNIFIIEHANVAGWGSGDRATAPFYYDLGLNKDSADVKRFISLMETYKECVIITGHTHLSLSAQYNYSDNAGTSAVMMHNSAIGGVRRLIDGAVNRDAVLGLSEGYIVEVYEDCILFNGINMYRNELMPLCTYIISFDTEPVNPQETTVPETTATTAPETTTNSPETTAPASTTADAPETSTAIPVTTTVTNPYETTTAPEPEVYLWGDVDLDGNVNVKDATAIQKYLVKTISLNDKALIQANVNGDAKVNIKDATEIQKKVANIIESFPSERQESAPLSADSQEQFDALADFAKSELSKYYQYSSFDQYQALKKALRDSEGTADYSHRITELNSLLDKLYEIIEASGGTLIDTPLITIYFSNNKNWPGVNAYVWGTSGKMSAWPGEAMAFVKTNDMNEDIYSITLDYRDYQNIIFNSAKSDGSGGEQTVDIALDGSTAVGYYLSTSSSGKWSVETYNYS